MHLSIRGLVAALGLLIALSRATTAGEATCVGDCDVDGTVTDEDIVTVVGALFRPDPLEACPGLLEEGVLPVVADLVDVLARTGPCEVNEPPVVPPRDVYRTYAGFEIALPISADDPDLPLQYVADELPEGALLEPDTGIFRWTPTEDQIRSYLIPLRVLDSGDPPLFSETTLALRVQPVDSATIPTCDPATGCTSTLPPLDERVCDDGPGPRVAEVIAECPGGRFLIIGRNVNSGFGRLQNCDELRLVGFSQAGIVIRINVAANCVATRQIVLLRSRLETATKLLINREDTIILNPTALGIGQRIIFTLPVPMATMDLEGQEANFSLRLTDSFTGTIVDEAFRVVLRHAALGDLPDLFCTSPDDCP